RARFVPDFDGRWGVHPERWGIRGERRVAEGPTIRERVTVGVVSERMERNDSTDRNRRSVQLQSDGRIVVFREVPDIDDEVERGRSTGHFADRRDVQSQRLVREGLSDDEPRVEEVSAA